MRIIEKKNGKTIHSPWFRPEDAAHYCGISRTEFDERSKGLPHAGNSRLRLYHQGILDQWLSGALAVPFDPVKKTNPKRFRKAKVTVIGITHPRTGRFSPCPTNIIKGGN